MTVTKVVGFDLRIPKHFSLNFSDFFTILYGIYKFVVFENKRKGKQTLASRPLEVLVLLIGGLWRVWTEQRTDGGRVSGVFARRQQGRCGEKGEGVEAHLWVVSGLREVLGGGSSTEQGGRRW